MKNLLYLLLPFLAFAFVKNEKPCVFIAGDSTASIKTPFDAPETGWGMVFPSYFDTEQVTIEDHAVNGRSTKSFRSLGHWEKMIAAVKPGDYVFLQFGHNDSKESDSLRYAPAQTDYRQNLIRYIKEIKAKGALAVVLTPVVRRNFDNNKQFVDKHGDYPSVAREVAAAEQVPLIDLWDKSRQLLEELGPEDSKALYMHLPPGLYPKFPEGKVDNTHFSPFGAALVASLVAEGVKESLPKLAAFLKKTAFNEKYEHELPIVNQPFFKKDSVSILDFGASPGGMELNTKAINSAMETIAKRGGGVVLIPAGLWLTGPISLQSNVNLHLETGALVQFTDDYSQYPLIRTNWEGQEAIRNQSPISGFDLENIAITGHGIFDGAGLAWRPIKRSKILANEWKAILASGGVLNETKDTWYPTEAALRGSKMDKPGIVSAGFNDTNAQEIKEFLRPNMVSINRCKNILIDGPTFQNSPAWTIHPLLCQHFTLKNITVKNPHFAQNADGVDVESTRFFRIENCVFDTGDDGVCLKSGRDEEGRKRGVATADGIVQYCTVYKAHGGFVIGSEMSGGVNNIYISNCTFLGSDIGLRFKTTRGRGGVVENIYVANINMTDIPHEAILFDMYYNGKAADEALKNPTMQKLAVTEETPVFRHFYFQNIACRGAEHAIYAQGLPEMNVQDIHIENSVFQSKYGFTSIEADNIQLHHVVLKTSSDSPALMVHNSRNLVLDQVQVFGSASQKSLKIEGAETGKIQLQNSDVRVDTGKEVPAGILIKN